MADKNDTPILPAHIENTVEAIARLHAEHFERSSMLQKIAERLTARVGQPSFIVAIVVVVGLWIAVNYGLIASGHHAFDEPPFGWLQGAISLVALFMTCIILATQRREDLVAGHREQLTLELGILAEQKSAKLIELLEELRRDLPMVRNRQDMQAEELASPADPQAILDAIRDLHEEPDLDGSADRTAKADA